FEQDAGFVLNPNFIIFHTTNYTNYKKFFEILVLGMNIINKNLDALIIERIGLRYLDAVILGTDENIRTHLSKDFLSVKDRFGLDSKEFRI
ncbi:TIGR04255 family protein, partial [Acinetobacter baumannii]